MSASRPSVRQVRLFFTYSRLWLNLSAMIHERTKAGLEAARVRGREGGRKPVLTAGRVRGIRVLLQDPEIQLGTTARRYGVLRTTLYRYVGKANPERS